MKLNDDLCAKTVSMLFRGQGDNSLVELVHEYCTCHCSRLPQPEYSPRNHATGCTYRELISRCTERFHSRSARDSRKKDEERSGYATS